MAVASVLRSARVPIACLGVSLALMVLLGMLGPSAGQPTLPGSRSLLPPWSFLAHPPDWLVCLVMYALLLIGASGTHLALRALANGWAPNVRRLLIGSVAGCVLLLLVPPMGSSDVLQYAAYGRIAHHYGGDVYAITPADVTSTVADPVTAAVGPAWPDTPSVYGPLATWIQRLASGIGSDSVQATVWVLQLVHGAAFVGGCLLAMRLTGREPRNRARAILLTVGNPVLVWTILVGAHVDALAAVAGMAALVVVRRSPFGAGLLLGVAGSVKVSLVLYGLAVFWALRRYPRALVSLCVGAASVLAGLYLTAGPDVFRQVLSSTSYVAASSPVAPLSAALHAVLPGGAAHLVVELVAWGAMVALVIALRIVLRTVESHRCGQTDPRSGVAVPAGGDPGVREEAVRATVVLSLAWLLTAPYTAGWYDVLAWFPLAACAASRLDRVLLVRTTVLAMAAVPGIASHLAPAWLEWTNQRLRDTLAPTVGVVLVVAILFWAHRRRKSAGCPTSP